MNRTVATVAALSALLLGACVCRCRVEVLEAASGCEIRVVEDSGPAEVDGAAVLGALVEVGKAAASATADALLSSFMQER